MSYCLEEELTSPPVATQITGNTRFLPQISIQVKTLPWQSDELGQKLQEEDVAFDLDC